MSSSIEYRRHAAECLRLAEHAGSPEARSFLMMMAAAWHRLAQDLKVIERPADGAHAMLHLVKPDRILSPETLALMTTAFDAVCQSVSKRINGNGTFRLTLALIILRHIEQGEHDPVRLADFAFANWQALTVR
jgi:hypothetical protein